MLIQYSLRKYNVKYILFQIKREKIYLYLYIEFSKDYLELDE